MCVCLWQQRRPDPKLGIVCCRRCPKDLVVSWESCQTKAPCFVADEGVTLFLKTSSSCSSLCQGSDEYNCPFWTRQWRHFASFFPQKGKGKPTLVPLGYLQRRSSNLSQPSEPNCLNLFCNPTQSYIRPRASSHAHFSANLMQTRGFAGV